MSSRTQRILANARKAKESELEGQEVNATASINKDYWKNDIAPEYSFLCDEEMDDCEKDPDFNPSSSDESEENVSVSAVKNKPKGCVDVRMEDLQKGSEITEMPEVLKKQTETNTTIRKIIVDLHHVTGSSKTLLSGETGNDKEVERLIEGHLELEEIENENVKRTPTDNQMTEKISITNNIIIPKSNNLGVVNNLEELENPPRAIKKRRRTLESQMESNKEKHPVRQPCTCKIRCWETFSDNDRHNINEDYWKMDRHLQRVWLSSKVTEELSKRKLRAGRRDITRKYVLPKKNLNGEILNTSVCQKFFLSTLGYSNANVLTSLRVSLIDPNGNKRLVPRKDQRGKHPPPNKKDRNLLIAHLNSYNPLPSHYAREHAPNRKYLPSDLTIKSMHNDYNSTHPDFKVCYEVYRQTIDQLNIGFYEATPEKCGFCLEMELEENDENQQRKSEHYADMQKVVLLPRMPDVKVSFFISRLIVYNETFASMQKKEGRHNLVLWHEGIAGRRAEDVASAFISFLKLNRIANEIIIWMDNCTGQNKNFTFYSAILCYINSPYCSTRKIILKYLVKGHTFMAADGIHGRIEQGTRKVKNIYNFNDFKLVCKKSSNRADVTVLEHLDFHKFENIIRNRKTNQGEESIPYFKDVVCAKFIRGSTDFMYQLCPGGEFLTTKNTLKRKAKLIIPDAMIRNRGVSVSKKAKIIADLVPKMPANRKEFWTDLPEDETSVDLIEDGI